MWGPDITPLMVQERKDIPSMNLHGLKRKVEEVTLKLESPALRAIGMEACEFGPDHVHVFVSGCKNYSVPQIAQRLKGASAHRIRRELWDRVKSKLWG